MSSVSASLLSEVGGLILSSKFPLQNASSPQENEESILPVDCTEEPRILSTDSFPLLCGRHGNVQNTTVGVRNAAIPSFDAVARVNNALEDIKRVRDEIVTLFSVIQPSDLNYVRSLTLELRNIAETLGLADGINAKSNILSISPVETRVEVADAFDTAVWSLSVLFQDCISLSDVFSPFNDRSSSAAGRSAAEPLPLSPFDALEDSCEWYEPPYEVCGISGLVDKDEMQGQMDDFATDNASSSSPKTVYVDHTHSTSMSHSPDLKPKPLVMDSKKLLEVEREYRMFNAAFGGLDYDEFALEERFVDPPPSSVTDNESPAGLVPSGLISDGVGPRRAFHNIALPPSKALGYVSRQSRTGASGDEMLPDVSYERLAQSADKQWCGGRTTLIGSSEQYEDAISTNQFAAPVKAQEESSLQIEVPALLPVWDDSLDREIQAHRATEMTQIQRSLQALQQLTVQFDRVAIESGEKLLAAEEELMAVNEEGLETNVQLAKANKSRAQWWSVKSSGAGVFGGTILGLTLGPVGAVAGASVGGAVGLLLGNKASNVHSQKMDSIIAKCHSKRTAVSNDKKDLLSLRHE